MRLVPINCVKDGSFLARSIYDLEGRILLSKGVKLTENILNKVGINGILSIYINDEYSNNEIEDTIRPELRQKAIKSLKDSFENFIKHNEPPGNNVSKTQINDNVKLKYDYIDKLNSVVNEIIEEVISKKNIIINLVDIKSMDNYTYEHSVNVIVLSLIIGLELNFSKSRLHNLAIGSMLHDIGKVFTPKEILLKNGKLTDAEYNIIKEHPAKGFDYLKDETAISAMSRIIILQHHERIDGTGYPEGIRGSSIHEFSKIVSIADVYDALTSDRPYRMGMPPNDAIEYIMGAADRYFDFRIVTAFLKRIVPYPAGTIVRLSNEEIGVVEEINQQYPLRPKIRIIQSNSTKGAATLIDLMEINNLVIKGTEYKIPDKQA